MERRFSYQITGKGIMGRKGMDHVLIRKRMGLPRDELSFGFYVTKEHGLARNKGTFRRLEMIISCGK